MTRDDILRMAREADLWMTSEERIAAVERFAALVAAPLEEEIKRLRFCIPEGDAAAAMEYLAHCVKKAVAEEREACAMEADYEAARWPYAPECREPCEDIAKAIRARGQ